MWVQLPNGGHLEVPWVHSASFPGPMSERSRRAFARYLQQTGVAWTDFGHVATAMSEFHDRCASRVDDKHTSVIDIVNAEWEARLLGDGLPVDAFPSTPVPVHEQLREQRLIAGHVTGTTEDDTTGGTDDAAAGVQPVAASPARRVDPWATDMHTDDDTDQEGAA